MANEQKMKRANVKKISAAVAASALLGSFLLFLFGKASYLYFLATAALTAIFAYKILPRMK